MMPGPRAGFGAGIGVAVAVGLAVGGRKPRGVLVGEGVRLGEGVRDGDGEAASGPASASVLKYTGTKSAVANTAIVTAAANAFKWTLPPSNRTAADKILGNYEAERNGRGRRIAVGCPAGDPRMPPDDVIQIRVRRLRESARLPHRASEAATGFDIYACLDADLELGAAPIIVPAGIAIEFPAGYDVQVRPRSGLSSKGVGVAFGTIDADYRGELLVTMWTFGGLDGYVLHDGDRIAQLVIARLASVTIVEAGELSSTARGDAGHGSTGR